MNRKSSTGRTLKKIIPALVAIGTILYLALPFLR